MNRRNFCGLAALTPFTLKPLRAALEKQAAVSSESRGFPRDDYTPFGYLDNPWHTWALHRSGVLRSTPGIGFSLYYPAGPGGYFNFAKNNVYEAQLALQFEINGRPLRTPQDFRSIGLNAPHHSKNLLTYEFEFDGVQVTCTFIQVNEDAIGTFIELTQTADRRAPVRLLAYHKVQLGAESWWGRDGLCGGFEPGADALWIRCFAAGAVFAVGSDVASSTHILTTDAEGITPAHPQHRPTESQTAYYPAPLYGALSYEFELVPGQRQSATVIMARGANLADSIDHARVSIAAAGQEIGRKRGEDAQFWDRAPQLTGNWPAHWKRGWVYDFETLRMMVRRPIGAYKHRWDAMQIQAPRNVLAETSIDMWALSYADPESAKEVFLGQFEDALRDNVPCMREDGTMNMVAADGSECGTSISWCFPYFCAESIFNRTRDTVWLRRLYPHLSALLRWTLTNRSDSGGFLVGKCSWETGMDASKRFLIEQPTGGELTEFVRLVELQAAASHAGRVLAQFANLIAERNSIHEWQTIADRYAARTQELWKGGWFHDFDTRSMRLVTSVSPDPAQSAPAFCGIATDDQRRQMRPILRKMYDNSRALGQNAASGWDDGLAWSSLVLPYVESIWASDDGPLAAEVVSMIAERIYRSMDRRSVENDVGSEKQPKLGWPGVSCEIWGAHGAFGGEGYGWGAVMPAHIIRSLVGARETEDPQQAWICPNLPSNFMQARRRYGLRNLRCGVVADPVDIEYRILESSRIAVRLTCRPGVGVTSIRARNNALKYVETAPNRFEFETSNNERCLIDFFGQR